MAARSVRSVLANCLGKTDDASLRRDLLCVYADDNPQTRSLKQRLDLLETAPFVRVALVTIEGATPNLQRDLDRGNAIYGVECGAWIYCTGSIAVDRPQLLFLSQDDCKGSGHSVSAEEDELFNLGRNLGATIVGYYIDGDSGGFRGCAAHPPGRRGFWVGSSATQWTWVHELTHVVGDNSHVSTSNPSNRDNLMWSNTGQITNPPPDLTEDQCDRINDDPAIEAC